MKHKRERVSRLVRWKSAALVLSIFALVNALGAQQSNSIVLLDVSGSMERDRGILFQRYSKGYAEGHSQMQELSQTLGATLERRCHCPVSLGQFSSSHEPAPISGPSHGSQLAAHVPRTAAGRDTELNFALSLGLKHSPDGLIFIITDNQNDFQGSHSDAEFYDMLAKDAAINSVYFVPLAEANSTRDALVLYGVGAGRAPRDLLRSVVSDFAAAVKSEAVQFRPLYEQEQGHPQLGFSQNISQINGEGDEQPAVLEGDSIVVPFPEGHSLDGGVKFKLHSNLKHWRIVEGHLTRAQVRTEVPPEFVGAAPIEVPVNISGGKKLNVNPGGDSAEIYTLPLNGLEDAGVTLRRSGFFQTTLPDIRVQVRLNAVIALAERPEGAGIQPVFSPALQQRMQAVRNLPEIMNAMTFQTDAASGAGSMERNIPITRELIVRVRPDGMRNALARAVLFGLPLLLLAAAIGAYVLARPQTFTLLDPAGRSRILEFSPFARKALVQWDGRTAAKLNKAGGLFRIEPAPGYKAEPLQLAGVPARFELINNSSGDRGQFQLRRGTVQSKSTSQGGRS